MAAKVKVNSYEEYNAESLFEYAGIDNIVTSDLLSKLMPTISTKPRYHQYHHGQYKDTFAPSILEEAETKHRALNFLIDMELNGFLYDQRANRAMHASMMDDLDRLEKSIYTGINRTPETLNLDSPTELAKFLYQEKKFPPQVFTKKNQPATSGDALKLIYEAEGLEWLNDLRIRNDISSVHSSFISTYIEDWVKSDGRIHPSYNLHGTSSHRISSDNPNLLNLPNPVHGYNVRSCYIVPKGHVFVTFDFSSCEVKILAALCRDPKMLEAIRQGLDFHSYTAATINDIAYDDLVAAVADESSPLHKAYKALRQAAKAVTFGILYGSSLFGIAAGLRISQGEAEKLVALYFATFPGIKVFVEDQHKMAQINQMVFSPFGQRKREFGTFPCFKGTAVYNAAMRNAQNVQIQGPASTLGLMSFAEMNDRNKQYKANSLATVYDSIEIEAPLNNLAKVIENGFYCMDDWPQEEYGWLDFPIGADAEIGFDWGEVVKVHRGETQESLELKLQQLNPAKYRECAAFQ